MKSVEGCGIIPIEGACAHIRGGENMLVYVALAGAVGAVVFSLLFIIMLLKGGSLKIPILGMVVFLAAAVAVSVILILRPETSEDPNASPEPGETVAAGESGAPETSAPAPSGEVQPGEESVAEQVLLDKRGIVIKATGLERDGTFGAELKVLIENSSSTDVTVQARSASVNGYMVGTTFSSKVVAGKQANDAITFLASDLEACGITTIADMEFFFHIFDDSFITFLDSDTVKVRTSAADTYQYRYDDSGEELHSENGVRIVSKGFSENNSVFGPGLVLFLENTTDKAIIVQVRDVSVNGFMVDTVFSEELAPGKRAIGAVTVLSTALKENNVEKIENMELGFHVFESDGWATIFDTEQIRVGAE